MNDPIMDFQQHKDVGRAIKALGDVVKGDPQRATPGYVRQCAGFLWAIIHQGIATLKEVEDMLLRNDALDQARKDYKAGKKVSDEAMQAVASNVALVFFGSVCPVLGVWAGKQSVGELIRDMAIGQSPSRERELMEGLAAVRDVELNTEMQQAVKDMVMPLVRISPEEVLKIETFPNAGLNDFCYLIYFGSGDRRYIERVIKALDQPLPKRSENADGQEMVEATEEGMVPLTAAWSLRSLSRQRQDIDLIVMSVPGTVRKIDIILAQGE
jgi:hypothetical protein